MIRRVLVEEEKSIDELEKQIKEVARQNTWNEECSNLIRKAAAQTVGCAKADPWVALCKATGDAITIVDLQVG